VLPVVTIFLGSALLFAVQPMIARMLLPRLGGAPAVWNACIVFFQAALLAGYAYAHGTGRLAPRRQLAAHAALLVLAAAALPFRLIAGGPGPGTLAPALWLLKALLMTIGLPFLALAAGAPLLQRWLSWSRRPGARDPYFLYAASNVGSLLALAAYPVLIEPALGLEQQRILWAAGYVVYLLLALACMALTWKERDAGGTEDDSIDPRTEVSGPPREQRLWWLALAAAPASLMLGVTSVLTTDVAAMPFLWILPLAVYLLTYVLAFSSPARLRSAGFGARRLPIAAVAFMLLWLTKATEPLPFVLAAYLAVLFVAAMACHAELARRRPHPAHLGGLIGGAFNGLLAPLAFRDWIEVPLAFTLACLLVPRGQPTEDDRRVAWSDLAIPAVLGVSTALLVKLGDVYGAAGRAREVLTAGVPALLAFLASERRLRFGLAVGAVLWAGSLDTAVRGPVLLTERSFFGIHRVTRAAASEGGRPVAFHRLYHGTTLHGVQRAGLESGAPTDPREALGYYSATSAVGRLFRAFPRDAVPRRVGVVGLGAGSLLAYAEPGQRWTLFEIDPLVKRIAEDERYFSYLPEARRRGVEAEVVLGDARLTLASAAGGFDVLVLDAFTSGAIPVHLLTREALDLYLGKLRDGGVLAFHISNRHLDLAPLMRGLGADLGLATAVEQDFGGPPSAASARMGSRWAFMARSAETLRSPGFTVAEAPPSAAHARVWTDDRSDLWSLFWW
jgi:hypothetical protein